MYDFNLNLDLWHISVGGTKGVTAFLNAAIPKLPGYIYLEPWKYEDGNLTKIEPGHDMNASQNSIDRKNTELEKWLNSLPEINNYHKKHAKQKKL